jgi:osmotically-inducible protein OsmY
MRNLVLVALLAASVGCTPVRPDGGATGSAFDDVHIEDRVIAQINSRYNGSVRVNVTSFNRHVLLTGDAPNEATKTDIGQLVAKMQDVRLVSNELEVGETHGLASHSSDVLVKSDVKLRFVKLGNFHSDDVKVVTENGTAYLMGQVSRKQAASAADLASTTQGVQRVITVFEYTN